MTATQARQSNTAPITRTRGERGAAEPRGAAGQVPITALRMGLALLIALGGLGLEAHAQRPMSASELVVLREAGSSRAELLKLVGERRYELPWIPATRRHLKLLGFDQSFVADMERLSPGPEAVNPAAGGTVFAIPRTGLVLTLPRGVTLEGSGARHEFRFDSLAGDEVRATLTVWRSRVERPAEVDARNLDQWLATRLSSSAERLRLGVLTPAPRAAYGLTGVAARAERTERTGNQVTLLSASAFSYRDNCVELRIEAREVSDSPSFSRLIASFERTVHSIRPAKMPWGAALPGTRIVALVRDAQADTYRILAFDRAGRVREELAEGRDLGALSSDPLGLHLAWSEGGTPVIAGAHGAHAEPETALPDATGGLALEPGSGRYLGAFARNRGESIWSWHPVARRGRQVWPFLLAPRLHLDGKHWVGAVIAPSSDRELALASLPLAPIEAPLPTRITHGLRPARTLEACPDPASSWWVAVTNANHYPLPGEKGAGKRSVDRLVYMGPEAPARLVAMRVRLGHDLTPWSSPSVLPSGHEIVFLDGEGRICMVPREGASHPVAIYPGRALAVRGWLDRRQHK